MPIESVATPTVAEVVNVKSMKLNYLDRARITIKPKVDTRTARMAAVGIATAADLNPAETTSDATAPTNGIPRKIAPKSCRWGGFETLRGSDCTDGDMRTSGRATWGNSVN